MHLVCKVEWEVNQVDNQNFKIMNLLGFFEKLKFRDESSYYNHLSEVVEIIGRSVTQYDGKVNELLEYLNSKEDSYMLDCFLDVMIRELRSRISQLGIGAFNKGNGLGYRLASEKELENLPLNKELIDVASNMGALLPSSEVELRSTFEQITLLKSKIKDKLTFQQMKEVNELAESVISFFDSPRLEKWDIDERIFFLVFNTCLEDLEPILDEKIKHLHQDELELVAEKLFIGYLDEDVNQGQLASIEFSFAAVRQLLPENVLKAFIDKMNDRLYGCTEDELATATYLMEKVGVKGYLSGRNIERLLEIHFSDMEYDLPFETPFSTIYLILDLKKFGVAYLPKAKYKVSAKVFLDFYMRYVNSPEVEEINSIREAVDFIPELLQNCEIKFLECFDVKVKKLEARKTNKPDKISMEKLDELKRVIKSRMEF